jgi:hypothetical protein
MGVMSVLYPVADTAEAALHAPKGFAARERTARDLAGGEVAFVTETVGPAFETEVAALDAYAGRLDDERPSHRLQVSPEARWCSLRPVAAPGARRTRKAIAPTNQGGRRWPAPDPKAGRALWRLSVSYWRIGGAEAGLPQPTDAARKLRRSAEGEGLDANALQSLARQPLQAMRPQQPLDIGLFETRPPEAPHIIMPDE